MIGLDDQAVLSKTQGVGVGVFHPTPTPKAQLNLFYIALLS